MSREGSHSNEQSSVEFQNLIRVIRLTVCVSRSGGWGRFCRIPSLNEMTKASMLKAMAVAGRRILKPK